MFHALHCWAIAQNVPLTYYYQSGYMLSNFRQRCAISYYAVQLHEGCLTPSCEWSLVKIKPTESEAEHCFCLWLRRLRSSENCIVGVTSRSGRIKQWQCSIPGLAICRFFRFCFWLRQPSFHLIISDEVVNGIGRNGNVLILPPPIPSSLRLRLQLRFSIFTRS